MKVLVVYSHPVPESFCAALRDTVVDTLKAKGHEVRLTDLYAEDFDPRLGCQERRDYHTEGKNLTYVPEHIANIQWADALIFVFPTWWYGLPAMLKGWLDRVFVPGVSFTMPKGQMPVMPALTNVKLVGGITTCGSPWWWMKIVGEPHRRTLLRGIRGACHPRCKTLWMAHYRMDSSTPESRKSYLVRVRERLSRL